jgi:small conductance mechanosensitive channel
MESITGFTDTLKVLAIRYLPSAAFAIVVLVIGWWIIGRVSTAFAKRMTNLEVSLRLFLSHAIDISLKILLVITAAGMLGIETTSFIAVLGTAGLAIGLALQGTLANFAGGVLILLFRPFKVGDIIETQGKTGTVTSIQIFNTILLTLTGETVILPNGAVSNSPLINFTTFDQSLIEITLQVENSTNIEHLRATLLPVLQREEKVRSLPLPSVGVAEISPGSVTISIKVYTKPIDVVAVRPSLLEHVKEHLSRQGIKMPVPHTFVHSISENSVAA